MTDDGFGDRELIGILIEKQLDVSKEKMVY